MSNPAFAVDPQVVLRYFNCRGRAQAFRYLFIDKNIPFTDERVEVEQVLDDPSSGPFASLPLLVWNGVEVTQTPAIASFLSRKLGHYRDAEQSSYLDMVTAGAYMEMLHPLGELAWLPHLHPHSDVDAYASRLAQRLLTRPAQLERLLSSPHAGPIWFGGDQPAVADYMVFTVLRMGLDAPGDAFAGALEACPKLRRHHLAMSQRPRLAAYLRTGQEPPSITSSPDEPRMLAVLRQAV